MEQVESATTEPYSANIPKLSIAVRYNDNDCWMKATRVWKYSLLFLDFGRCVFQ
jgi:hypothetical protein